MNLIQLCTLPLLATVLVMTGCTSHKPAGEMTTHTTLEKTELKRIASTAKRDFTNKVRRAWDVPSGSTGKQATVRVILNDSGSIVSMIINSSDPEMKASVEAAVRAAAPYPMPSDPEARREARNFSATFTAR